MLQEFIRRLFTPRLARPLSDGGQPAGRELLGDWRYAIAYRLAELGYGLPVGVTVRGLRPEEATSLGRAEYRDGVLLVDGGSARDGRFRPEFLALDVPNALIDRPACQRGASPEEQVASRLAAAFLSSVRLTDPANQDLFTAEIEHLLALPTDKLLARMVTWASQEAPEAVRRILSRQGPQVFGLARATIDAVLEARSRGESLGSLPVTPVVPGMLTRYDLPAQAISWISDHYGWRPAERSFLPLQVLGIMQGVCDPRSGLFQSGVVAAPTSAGKTLLAELRMLGRWFSREARGRKTIFLSPTRELAAERVASLRSAYGTRGNERRLRILYSDGENHGDDGALHAGHFDVAVMVAEKLKGFGQSAGFRRDLGEIVIEELSTMAEPGRGPFLELVLTSALRGSSDTTVLGLTHPSRGLDGVLQAMQRKPPGAFLLEVTQRPVPLETGIWAPQTRTITLRNCNTGTERTIPLDLGYPDIRKTLKRLLITYVRSTRAEHEAGRRNNLVIAVPTKSDTLNLSAILAQLAEEDGEVRAILAANSNPVLLPDRFRSLELTFRRTLLQRLLPMGIAFHDADLSREERQLVGHAFREGEICVLVCTRTMAQGINLPAQTIAFLQWASRPGRGEDAGEPFYKALEPELITWIGRVGRYGKGCHRRATALYVAAAPPGSEEYSRIHAILQDDRGSFASVLRRSLAWEETVLSAVQHLTAAVGKPPTLNDIAAFLGSTPSAMDEKDRKRIQSRAAAALGEMAWPVGEERGPEAVALIQYVEDEGEVRYSLTPMGQIAYAYGVCRETVERLYAWLIQAAELPGWGWDVLDLLAVVWMTPDGQRINPLRPHRAHWDYIRDELLLHVHAARARLGREWEERSPLLETSLAGAYDIGTFLALRDWRRGEPIYAEGQADTSDKEHLVGIETAYGLIQAGCSLHEKAREYGRLLRVLAAVADQLPKDTFPPARPEELAPLAEEVVGVPWDLQALANEIVFGVPDEAIPIARLNVEGLTRGGALSCYQAVRQQASDLPILERLKQLTEDAAVYQQVLPTHGLRERLKEALTAQGRAPLAERLRGELEVVERLYRHPLVIAAQLWQGRDRFTALRVVHRGVYTVMRRNEAPDQPILLKVPADVARWREQRAVEFLSEVGRKDADGYGVDAFLVDLDPYNGYDLETLRTLAGEVLRRLGAHEWVDGDRLAVNWTGGKGFHLVAPFQQGVFRPVDAVKRALDGIVRRVSNDVSLFAKEQPTLAAPHVVLDTSPVMRRGVYRNAFSLHSLTGNVCVPVEPARLAIFDPEEATPLSVLSVLETLGDCEGVEYPELLTRFWAAVRLRFSPDADLPVLRAVPTPPPAPPSLALTVIEPPFQPAAWPPRMVVTPAQMDAVLPAIASAEVIGLDIETTTFSPRSGQVRLISVATETATMVVDVAAVDPRPLLQALVGKRLVGHNIGFDLRFLMMHFGFDPVAAEDTMHLSQLLHAGESRGKPGFHGLGNVARRHLGFRVPKELQRSDWSGPLTREQIEYAGRDAAVLLPLRARMLEAVEAAGLTQTTGIERRCLPCVVWMQNAGVPIDPQAWEGLATAAEREAEAIRRELDAVAPPAPGYETGSTWRWNSPRSVLDALRLAGLDLDRTDDDTLSGLDHPLAGLVRRYRAVRKVATTYGKRWLARIEDGRLYADWRQIGSATGRMAASDPPVQTIPRGAHRDAIAAPPGRVLVRGDYGQIELRIAARIAADDRLTAAFNAGTDIYRQVARMILGDETARELGKTIALGLLFGMSADGLRREVRARTGRNLGEAEAAEYREKFFVAFSRLREWQAEIRRERPRESRTLCGRRLLLPENAPDRLRFNAPIQGTAADGLKRALALLWERREQCPEAVPVIAVHDEIVVECPEQQAEATAAWLERCLRDGMSPLLRPVPVEVAITIGTNWGGA